jgi:uncharacterized protein (DUF1800 family)
MAGRHAAVVQDRPWDMQQDVQENLHPVPYPEPPVESYDDVPRQRGTETGSRSAGKHADPRSTSALSRRQALVVVGAGLTAAACGGTPSARRAIDKAVRSNPNLPWSSVKTPSITTPAPGTYAIPGNESWNGSSGMTGTGRRRATTTRSAPRTGGAAPAAPAPAPAAPAPEAPPPPGGPQYTMPVPQGAPLNTDQAAHLLRRATFGPTPETLGEATMLHLEGWLEWQLAPQTIDDTFTDGLMARYPLLGLSSAQLQNQLDDGSYDAMNELVRATIARQVWSRRQLQEVMVDFWSNHFNVTTPSGSVWDLKTTEDREVIRPNALGNFSDLLMASAKSPAMLRYLNNDRSRGDRTNENYGRELLELHTVGVDGGYTEADVLNSAYIMTGFSIADDGSFLYRPDYHYTGPVTVLGFSSANAAEDGLAVGEEYLRYLATHPATANYLATKLAIRFVADEPPASLIATLAQTYLDNGTAIAPVLRALFTSPEFWNSLGAKVRRPLEDVVASTRVLGVQPGDGTDGIQSLYYQARELGMAPLGWNPPDGYPDVASEWVSPMGTLGRWNFHRGITQGWWEELSYGNLPDLLGSPAPATYGEAVDRLAQRLLFRAPTDVERATFLTFLEQAADAPADADLGGLLQHVVPLYLDSSGNTLR